MMEHDEEKGRVVPLAATGAEDELPFRIELWDAANTGTVERVLARAHSAPLAQAIFKAARIEHPDRRITLSRGSKVIGDSAA